MPKPSPVRAVVGSAASSLRTSSEDTTAQPVSAARRRATVDLPVPGSPPNDHEAHPRSAQLVEGQRLELGGLCPGRRVALGRVEVGDLGAHQRPVRDVVVEQSPRHRRAGRALVLLDQRLGVCGVPRPAEVHHQEREVGRHVDAPQVVVELDAVEDPRAVIEDEDVLGPQVAMAVADEPVVEPVAEERGSTQAPARRQTIDLLDRRPSRRVLGMGTQLLDGIGPPVPHGAGTVVRARRRDVHRAVVEGGESSRDRAHAVRRCPFPNLPSPRGAGPRGADA